MQLRIYEEKNLNQRRQRKNGGSVARRYNRSNVMPTNTNIGIMFLMGYALVHGRGCCGTVGKSGVSALYRYGGMALHGV